MDLLCSLMVVVADFILISITVEWIFTLLSDLGTKARGWVEVVVEIIVVIDYVISITAKCTIRYPPTLCELLHYMRFERHLTRGRCKCAIVIQASMVCGEGQASRMLAVRGLRCVII